MRSVSVVMMFFSAAARGSLVIPMMFCAPPGHGDYSYQQSSYSEQGYERSFEESSQHYYEGGNSQYNQQQASYQQGANQAAFNQQQYPSQQGYSGQQAPHRGFPRSTPATSRASSTALTVRLKLPQAPRHRGLMDMSRVSMGTINSEA
nr:calcium-responsive transactivator-like isoform X2 [Paramormyrops kingsleyae]